MRRTVGHQTPRTLERNCRPFGRSCCGVIATLQTQVIHAGCHMTQMPKLHGCIPSLSGNRLCEHYFRADDQKNAPHAAGRNLTQGGDPVRMCYWLLTPASWIAVDGFWPRGEL